VTQLIGAICECGKKIVTVSDRMVSSGDMTLTFEQERMKAIKLTDHSLVLTAGTAHQPDLIRDVQRKCQGQDSILGIAKILKEIYQKYRKQKVVDMVLIPKLGIHSFDEWHEKQRKLHDHIVLDASNDIGRLGLGLRLILAGVDEEGHLISIHDPGDYTSFDNLSYCCEGIGTGHANAVFAFYRYSRKFSVSDAMYIAFEAKKRAEMAGGVGQKTDILLIDKEQGIQRVSDETIVRLEEIYDDRENQTKQAGVDKRITTLNISADKL